MTFTPIVIVPLVTASTVKVVPEIDAVTSAAFGDTSVGNFDHVEPPSIEMPDEAPLIGSSMPWQIATIAVGSDDAQSIDQPD